MLGKLLDAISRAHVPHDALRHVMHQRHLQAPAGIERGIDVRRQHAQHRHAPLVLRHALGTPHSRVYPSSALLPLELTHEMSKLSHVFSP